MGWTTPEELLWVLPGGWRADLVAACGPTVFYGESLSLERAGMGRSVPVFLARDCERPFCRPCQPPIAGTASGNDTRRLSGRDGGFGSAGGSGTTPIDAGQPGGRVPTGSMRTRCP